MDLLLNELSAGLGVGSLACGADILWNEALHRRDAEVHLFIPGSDQEFIAESVSPGGPNWVKRYEAMLDVATTVTRVSRNDRTWEQSFRRTSDAAFTWAIEEARQRNMPLSLVAVWDGTEATGRAGTAADVAAWRRLGLPVHLVRSRGQRV